MKKTLGQLINEFDNSTGTVEAFNKLFPLTPIEGVEGFIEILGIVGVGNECCRYLKSSVREFQHDFESYKKDEILKESVRIKAHRRRFGLVKKRIYYTYYAKKGNVVKEFLTAREIADFLKTNQVSINQTFLYKYNPSRFDGWTISREER